MKVIFAVALGAVLMVIVVLMISTRSPGNALVYDRIEASTSCTELEIEFDAVVGPIICDLVIDISFSPDPWPGWPPALAGYGPPEGAGSPTPRIRATV